MLRLISKRRYEARRLLKDQRLGGVRRRADKCAGPTRKEHAAASFNRFSKMIEITKMHGLGNDFLLVENARGDLSRMAQELCSRHTSVGADGLINVLPSDHADIRMQIINSDGSEAQMCGNGIRCFTRYVFDKGIVPKHTMTVETGAGIMEPALITRGDEIVSIRVNMGKPDFSAEAIPMRADDPLDYVIEYEGVPVRLSSVLMGVPHTVLFNRQLQTEQEISLYGSYIESHEIFPEKTNVNFVDVIAPDRIRVRTWERGAGRTLACGTGSCASAVLAAAKGLTGRRVTAELELGNLEVEIAEDGTVFMTGPAEYVFCLDYPIEMDA